MKAWDYFIYFIIVDALSYYSVSARLDKWWTALVPVVVSLWKGSQWSFDLCNQQYTWETTEDHFQD